MPELNKDRDVFYRQVIYPEAYGLMSWSPQALDQVKDEAIVVVDTNALLAPYGTGKTTLEVIRETYRSLADKGRLVVPGQVIREFAANRVVKLRELHQQLVRKKQVSIPRGAYPLLEGLDHYSRMTSL
jgi:rRNA-processing protein FCF1